MCGILKKIYKSKVFELLFFALIIFIVFGNEIISVLSFLKGNIGIEGQHILGYDYINQHISFHKEFFRILDGGNIFSWSWNLFLGTNFYVSKAYYLIGDVFTYLAYIYNGLFKNIEASMFFVMLTKLILGGFGFSTLLQKINVKKWIAFMFGIFFIFSGWQSVFLEHPMYTSFYAILPFVLLGVERIIQNRKFSLFFFTSGVLLCINYYLMFSACILILIYWIVRYIQYNDKFVLKEFMILSFKTLGIFVVMLAVTAFLWLPSLVHILDSTRIGTELYTYNSWPFESKAAILTNFISPIIRYGNPIFDQGWYYFNQIGIYSGVLCLVLLPSVWTLFKNIKLRITYITLIITCFLLLISPEIGKLFYFTYSLRYTFIISMILLLIGAQVLSNTEKFNPFLVLLGVLGVFSVFGIVYYVFIPGYYGQDGYGFIESEIIKKSAVIAIFYGVSIMLIGRFKKSTFFAMILIALIAMVEVSSIGAFSLKSSRFPTPQYTFIYGDTYFEYKEAISKIRKEDPSFYRIYSSIGMMNEQLYDGMLFGLKTYDSVYQYQIRDFLNHFRMYPDTNWIFDFNTKEYWEALGVKYVAIKNQEFYLYEWFIEPERVESMSTDNISVYKTKNEPYIGTTFNKIIDIQEVTKISENWDNYLSEISDIYINNLIIDIRKSNIFEDYINNDNFVKEKLMPIEYESNYMRFESDLDYQSAMNFSIPFDRGWTCTVNGLRKDIYKTNGGFMTVLLDSGHNDIEFEFSVFLLKEASIISLIGTLMGCLLLIVSVIKSDKYRKSVKYNITTVLQYIRRR